jgi:hypothetical protein
MNSRGILYSDITASNIEDRCNEIIKKHLEAAVKECKGFPSKVEKKVWLSIQEKLMLEIEDLEFRYCTKLTELLINFNLSKNLFQESKSELKSLIKESITKSKVKGFESEAYYGVLTNRRSIIALFISIASIIIAAIALFISRK